MSGICFVLEGGAQRGNFTAGILDVLLEERAPEADCLIGVSAGSLCGANYLSHQIGRTVRVNCTYCNDPRYLSMRNVATGKDALDPDFMYNRIQNELDPFDYDAFANRSCDFYVVCTNVFEAKAEYVHIDQLPEQIDYVRASASMPVVSHLVEVDGLNLLDGGTADSIPVQWALDQGFDKVLCVMTQDRSYKKTHEKTMPLINRTYADHPQFCALLDNRHLRYNQQRKDIFELEERGRVFVVTPDNPVTVGSMEKDPAKLVALYNEGRAVMKRELAAFLKYLEA